MSAWAVADGPAAAVAAASRGLAGAAPRGRVARKMAAVAMNRNSRTASERLKPGWIIGGERAGLAALDLLIEVYDFGPDMTLIKPQQAHGVVGLAAAIGGRAGVEEEQAIV